jgi:DtxR family Mn-dependent transcriptional regulator
MAIIKTTPLSASLEDYLEAILNLSTKDGHAHSKDIAERLNVARPSVTGALRTLKKKGLADYKPYGSVTLTKTGRKAARKVARKHEIIKSFFVDVLGVENETAQQAACKAEHALGPEVISKLLCFSEFVGQHRTNGHNLIRRFQKFCNHIEKDTKV